MKKTLSLFASLLLFSLGAFAQITFNGFPPPGGVTFNGSGPGSGVAGGKTFSYAAFNSSAYGQLYYGNVNAANVFSSPLQGGGTGNMVFAGFGPVGEMIFTSTSPWVFNTTQGQVNVPTMLIMQLQNYTGTNLGFQSSGFIIPDTTNGALGIGGQSNNPLLTVTGPFQVHFEFFVNCGNGISCQGVNDFYNSFNTFGDVVNTSLNQGFWSTAPTSDTPEPASLALLGSGLVGLGGIARRKLRR